MLTIQIGVTDKRINSTQIPSNSLWMDSKRIFSNCTFKEGTSFETPTVQIRTADDLSNCNYMTIAHSDNTSKKFYWITDIHQVNNIWEITGRKDNLAQYRSQIGELNAQVLRCGRNWNHDVIDDQCIFSHVEAFNKMRSRPFNLSFDVSAANKWAVLNLVGIKITDQVKNTTAANDNIIDIDDIIESSYVFCRVATVPLMLEIIEYLVTNSNSTCDWSFSNNLLSAYVLPFNPISKLSTSQYKEVRQWWIEGTESAEVPSSSSAWADEYMKDDFNAVNRPKSKALTSDVAYALTDPTALMTFAEDWNFPEHPQYGATNYNWLNRPDGVAEAAIYWPPAGKLGLPVEKMSNKIRCRLQFSIASNSATLVVYNYSDGAREVLGQLAVKPLFPALQVSNIIESTKESKWAKEDAVWNTAGLAISGVASAMTGDVGGLISTGLGIRETWVNANRTVTSQTEVISQQGSYEAWTTSDFYGMQLQVSFKIFIVPDQHLFGRPLYARRRIDQCGPDAIQCGTIDLSLPGAMPDEVSEIVHFLQGGFYFE